ncbi:YegP family protein [Kitasatospora sp. NPDC059577]|uniref:YegP family protein n=1 Tax=unclassified Kitasatospora TaxID=2633591 RepID=UPI0036B20DA2
MSGKFEIYEDSGGTYRFRLKAGNGEIVATGQGYASKDAAHKGVEAVRRAADGAAVVDVPRAA